MIETEGPIPFSQFMAMALYDPADGYYAEPRDPFGRSGDFFTAAQLQPVFGRYVLRLMEFLSPSFENCIELGAGREDMRDVFSSRTYSPVHPGERIPKTKKAILFANEFFDALPIDLYNGSQLLAVGIGPRGFEWHPEPPKRGVREQRPAAALWLLEAWEAIECGHFVIIDYGYRARELIRFPEGTLMSYRRHVAIEDVLSDPGKKDISAHVDWDSLLIEARKVGWHLRSFERFQSSLLSLGSAILEELALLDTPQLKRLLLCFGEGFDVLILEKPWVLPTVR